MNPAKIATALNTLQLGLAELAEALNDSPATVSAGGPEAAALPAAAPASSFETSPFEPDEFPQPSLADESVDFATNQGSERMCPIHKAEMKPKPWDPTLYGCTLKGSEPAWTNAKGYCTITSKNVATYLNQRAAVA